MTFVMNPLLYPYVMKHGPQLDFHPISDRISSYAFGFPPLTNNPNRGLKEQVMRGHQFLKGANVEAMLGSFRDNLMLVLRQDHVGEQATPPGPGGWWSTTVEEFCSSAVFTAVILTIFGKPPDDDDGRRRRSDLQVWRKKLYDFDRMFPFLAAQCPVWLLGRTSWNRRTLQEYFLPQKMKSWSNSALFTQNRLKIFDQYDDMQDIHKAAHHFAILWASTINTVPSAFWCLNGALTSSEATAKLRAELKDNCGLGDTELSTDVRLTREDLDKLVYLDSLVNEGLRVSAASIPPRLVLEDTTIQLGSAGSVHVRKGDIVGLFPLSTHMDPEIYDDPETFKFDRFVQDGQKKTDFYKNGQRLKHYLLPFGYGASRCPGQGFALYSIKLFISVVLLNFEVQVDEGQTRPCPNRMRGGLGTLPPIGDTRFRYRLWVPGA
ncbi:25-hydroxycholesterol 7-alpha-hydroxylase isoform X2 [Cynoglossus semilaevis]|nr:25-hydroxycholesterol 7-alpha-hydroxylase isoform X2 [Cynoglossus semilaevis]